jgi:enoyl-[acyl-carrier-protein] reductase (NADH)
MPEGKTKYDLLQEQINSVKNELKPIVEQFNQIKESLLLFDHFKETLKNVPVDSINQRLDLIERTVNEKTIEVSIYESISLLKSKVAILEKKTASVNKGILTEDYLKEEHKDITFARGEGLVDHSGKVVSRPEKRPVPEPETIWIK